MQRRRRGFGISLNYPNEPWGGNANFKHIGANYFPALGFVNRTGIRVYDGNFGRRDRNIAGLRFIDTSTTWNIITDISNHLESRENILALTTQPQSTDEFQVRVHDFFEDVPEPFLIADTVPVFPGPLPLDQYRRFHPHVRQPAADGDAST